MCAALSASAGGESALERVQIVERARPPAGPSARKSATRADRRQRREQLGVAEADLPGAAPAHRQAGERDPVGIDVVGAPHVGDHAHDVVVAQAVVAHQLAAPERRHDERGDVGQRQLVARRLGVVLARAVVEAEHAPQVVAVVGERAVQRDDQRPAARRPGL